MSRIEKGLRWGCGVAAVGTLAFVGWFMLQRPRTEQLVLVLLPVSALLLVLAWLVLTPWAWRVLEQFSAQAVGNAQTADPAGEPAQPTTAATHLCLRCGAKVHGPFCVHCKAPITADVRVRLAGFLAHHSGAIMGTALGVLVGPAALSFLWQASQSRVERQLAAETRQHERAARAIMLLASFRSAVWQFASDCVPRSTVQREHGATPDGAAGPSAIAPQPGGPLRECREVYSKIVDGYIHWSWMLAEYLGDVKESQACQAVTASAKQLTPRQGSMSRVEVEAAACSFLDCPLPMLPVSAAYNLFTNHYARYLRTAKPEHLRMLGESTRELFQLTLRMGCAIVTADYLNRHSPDLQSQITDITGTGYCDGYLRELAQLQRSKRGREWCGAAYAPELANSSPARPSSDASAAVPAKPDAGVQPLEWSEWFAAPP